MFSKLLRLVKSPPRDTLAILGFHNLRPTWAYPPPVTLDAYPARFRRLVRMLSRRYDMVTVSEGVERLGQDGATDRPMMALVFDDGYRDFYTDVVPILTELGCRATCYAIVDCLETGRLPWYEELGRIVFESRSETFEVVSAGETRGPASNLGPDMVSRVPVYHRVVREMKRQFTTDIDTDLARLREAHDVAPETADARLMMNVAEAKEVSAAGFEIGCHSARHPILSAVDEACIDSEIVVSRDRLASLLERPVTSFCYPNGDRDERCRAAIERAGYASALTMTTGANRRGRFDAYELRRIPMPELATRIWPWHTRYRVHGTLLEA